MKPVLLALLSCLGSSALVGLVTFLTRAERPLEESVRVAVLKRDHPDGAPLTADELGEVLVPGELVSSSWLSPEDAATRVGKPCLVGAAGSALTESHFADLTWSDRTAACAKAVSKEVDAAADAEVEKIVSSFTRRDEPAREVPKGRVLFVARALREGDVLKDGDVREGEAPAGLVTESWVPAERRAELVGQQVIAALDADTPLWWQALNVSGTTRSCEFEVRRALDDARRRAAASWVEKESSSW